MKMLKINFTVIFFIAVSHLFSQDIASSWLYSKDLKISGDAKYKYFFLDKDVYKYAKPDLSDIRIIDADGTEMPYFISRGYSVEQKDAAEYEPKIIKTFKETVQDKTVYQVFDFQILSDKKEVAINSMSLTLAGNDYSFQAEIYGRKNNTEWNFILKDSVYNIGGFVKEEIDFGSSFDYNFYRIKIPENIETLKIVKCSLSYNGSIEKFHEFRKNENAKFTISNKDTYSLVKIENSSNLKIISLDLSIDLNFSRDYELYRNEEDVKSGNYFDRGRIYRMNFGGKNIADTDIELQGIPASDNFFVLKIINNNDRPLKISAITVEYIVDKLVFEMTKDNNDKRISLIFGNTSAVKPLYDIENFIPYIEKEKMDHVETLAMKSKAQKPVTKSNVDFKIIFNIIVAIVAVFLITGIVLLLRKKQ